jgi:hypothetical protein
MTIVLAGGTGLLGRSLAAALSDDGFRVLTLTRRPRKGVDTDVAWTPDGNPGPWASVLEGAVAVVNLAGEGIADKRWSAARKAALLDSRVLPTRSLARAIAACRTPPRVFVSSSAVGYYGACGDEPVTEVTKPGADPLSALCVQWEAEAMATQSPEPKAQSQATRVAIIRTGLVLDRNGGMLKEMLLPFRLGLGARLGSGRQYMPWIHVHDWIALVRWIIATGAAHGVFNLTAPEPVTNAEFTRVMGRVLRRPAVFWAPPFVLRILVGEFAAFLLAGQRALPVHAEQLGFQFKFRELEPALRDLLT